MRRRFRKLFPVWLALSMVLFSAISCGSEVPTLVLTDTAAENKETALVVSSEKAGEQNSVSDVAVSSPDTSSPDIPSADIPLADAVSSAAATAGNQEEPVTQTVWVTASGSKYHSKASCSNMKNPKQISLNEATENGYTPCKKCVS